MSFEIRRNYFVKVEALRLKQKDRSDKVKGFRNLIVWQKSHQLTLDIYKLTAGFPEEEKFGIISQLRRAAVSIPNNIAEGSGRKSAKEFSQFLSISLGSTNEVDYLIMLSEDLGYNNTETTEKLFPLIEEIKSMLYVLINNKS